MHGRFLGLRLEKKRLRLQKRHLRPPRPINKMITASDYGRAAIAFFCAGIDAGIEAANDFHKLGLRLQLRLRLRLQFRHLVLILRLSNFILNSSIGMRHLQSY